MYDLAMLFILTIVLFFAIGLPGILFAPWVPTKRRDLDRINELMDIHPGMHVMDLGCGTGGVLFYLARHHPDATFEGIELSFLFYFICVIRKYLQKATNVHFRLGNVFTATIVKADRMYLFGTPRGLSQKLKEKLKKELKPDARIITYCFEMSGWQPEQVAKPEKNFLPVYRYKIPPKK
ncbi:hypothetical protein IT408_02375 [Candidatus Uhrbacteria bacterium]|nr:hypothetical protein [Candidatus Uhrbacteria bacterium]